MVKVAATKGTTIEEGMQWVKRTSQDIVDKKSVRITRALRNKASLYFGSIVPIDSFN